MKNWHFNPNIICQYKDTIFQHRYSKISPSYPSFLPASNDGFGQLKIQEEELKVFTKSFQVLSQFSLLKVLP